MLTRIVASFSTSESKPAVMRFFCLCFVWSLIEVGASTARTIRCPGEWSRIGKYR